MTSWTASSGDPFDAIRKFFGDMQEWWDQPRGAQGARGSERPSGDRWEQTREDPRETPRTGPGRRGERCGERPGGPGRAGWPGPPFGFPFGWPGGPGRGGWPGGPGRGWHGVPRGPRAGRGDVRLAILALLAEQPMHGYQLIQEISRRSAGAWKPSPGSVYPTLQQLEDEGLVYAQQQDGKRVYTLTDDGQAFAQERADELASMWDGYQPDDRDAALGDLVFGVASAFVHVMRTGSERQVAAARDVLARTRAELFRILGQDGFSSGSEGTPDQPSDAGAAEGDNGDTGESVADVAEPGESDQEREGGGERS